jgi:hypothetical protein
MDARQAPERLKTYLTLNVSNPASVCTRLSKMIGEKIQIHEDRILFLEDPAKADS